MGIASLFHHQGALRAGNYQRRTGSPVQIELVVGSSTSAMVAFGIVAYISLSLLGGCAMNDDPAIERPALDRADPLGFNHRARQTGQWIVVERHGLYGGIFNSELAARRFAKFESGSQRSSISVSAQPLDLYGAASRAA